MTLAASDGARVPRFDALGLLVDGAEESWAAFSKDRRYRYLLARTWDWSVERPLMLMLFIMLNPSTADAVDDDATIRRCIGFARRERCGGILVANLFAWRETQAKRLLLAADPVGEQNVEVLRLALGSPIVSRIVCAWGALSPKLIARSDATRRIAMSTRPSWCLGKTRSGQPRHPVRLANDTPLIALSVPGADAL